MLFPVRCFTCGKVVAEWYDKYAEKVKAGESPAKVLDELGMDRYCCRRMFLGYVDVADDVIKHGKF